MAVRSSAGTGVIVSLVVFVITTVALLILTIVFYSGQLDAEEARDAAIAEMEQFITIQERNRDPYQRYIAGAEQQRRSVAAHMQSEIESIMRYVAGDANTRLDQVRGRLQAYGVPEDGIVSHVLQDRHREARESGNRIDDLQGQLASANNQISELNSRIERIRREHREALQAVEGEIDGYRRAAEEHREEVNRTKRAMDEAVDRLHDQYENQITELEDEIDDLHRERVVLRSRVEDLQERLSAERIRAQDPATLVDGRIIEIAGPEGEVYIDRGNQHRIVLGMTFEVYDDAASIRVDPRTGEMARGKATIQIVRVGDSTSTARITRSVPGRPVVRNDVIANAVYDPEYRFKFMVHGRFDLDGDGRATATEREYIEQLILDWGGELVTDERIPGDLDFLVLGVMPPEVGRLRHGATDAEFQDHVRRREARDRYMELFEQAREAQIPILNHNRFLILTGQYTPR